MEEKYHCSVQIHGVPIYQNQCDGSIKGAESPE